MLESATESRRFIWRYIQICVVGNFAIVPPAVWGPSASPRNDSGRPSSVVGTMFVSSCSFSTFSSRFRNLVRVSETEHSSETWWEAMDGVVGRALKDWPDSIQPNIVN